MAIDYKVLEQALHLEEGTLEQAAQAEDNVDLDLSKVKVFKLDDFETLQNNHRKELEEKEKYSNQVGKEMTLKSIVRELLPEDFEGRKDETKVVEAIKQIIASKDEAAKEPDQALKDALEQIDAFKNVLSSKEKEIQTEQEKYGQLQAQIQKDNDNRFINSQLSNEYAKYADKLILGKDDLLTIYKSKTGIDLKDNQISLTRNGEIVKNDLQSPKTLEEDFKEFASNYLKKVKGGAGDQSANFKSKMTSAEWEKAYRAQNPNATQQQLTKDLIKAIQNKIVS